MKLQPFSPKPIQSLIKLGKRAGLLSLLLWLVTITEANAGVEMRVAIKRNVNDLRIGSSTNAVVKDGGGRVIGEISGMNSFNAQRNGSNISIGNLTANVLLIEPRNNGYVWIGDRWYRGKTRLVNQGGQITAVNHVDIEQYLYSVVGAEAVASWPIEALKAQAVAARTYALHKRSQSKNPNYDVDTTTATQVYKGLDSEYSSTVQAVGQTNGQVMTYNGQTILAVFHSSSGGHTENVEDIWSSRLPYLRGVVDYDQSAPVYQWTKTFTGRELGNLISGVGTVTAMTPERTTPQGRVITMRVTGTGGTTRISGENLRKALNLRSTLVSVSPLGNGSFQVYGKGFGHGVGLSQWGAESLAQQGLNYQQILGHYYSSASLSQIGSR
jgi:stage II sporulation protein D